jgi:hypothetical protein
MASSVWNEGTAWQHRFTVSSAVHAWEFMIFSSRQQLSAPLAICTQLQLVSSVVRHGEVHFRATCISVCHPCQIWIC